MNIDNHDEDKNEFMGSSRYRLLIISIAVFLSLIGALLAFTFYMSSVLHNNTTIVNTSNGIAISSEALLKDLFDAQLNYGVDPKTPHMTTVLTRMKQNSVEIDDYLGALENGGEVKDRDGHIRSVPKVTDTEILTNLTKIKEEWLALKPKVNAYTAIAGDIRKNSQYELFLATDQAQSSSLALQQSLHELTDTAYAKAQSQADQIRLIQVAGVLVILGYFVTFIFFFVRRLRQSDEQTLAVQKEIQDIMATVNTGLFLLDNDLNIGHQYSKALEKIIGSEQLAGETLNSVLRNRISDKDLQTTEEFIAQLYNPRVKEKLVDSLNPLHKVMIYDGTGGDIRYLDFKFSRVYQDKKIARILVNVNDVSEAVLLEQRLEKERAENDMQIEMLTTILNVNPTLFDDFINNTFNRIEKMNNILKNPGSSQFELEGKLKSIYREMHSLKGEASALKLHSFTKIASNAEDKLNQLQNESKLAGNDFLSLAIHLDELFNLSSTISKLGSRLNNTPEQTMTLSRSSVNSNLTENATQEIVQATPTPEEIHHKNDVTAQLSEYLVNFGKDIADRQHKSVNIDVSRMADVKLPTSLFSVVKEISIQLLRNAVVHGIDDSESRVQKGKSSHGKVSIIFKNNEEDFIFAVEDDGKGIDYDEIRQKLLATNQYRPEQVNEFSQQQLINFLFTSGFSTRSIADEDGGRGVGLDIIKERVKEYGGKMNVQSEKDKFTRFIIKLPIKTA